MTNNVLMLVVLEPACLRPLPQVADITSSVSSECNQLPARKFTNWSIVYHLGPLNTLTAKNIRALHHNRRVDSYNGVKELLFAEYTL